jgi:phenylpropionate dioxygenase-like ring-hydroxylating dioxygenase large terminal subunit
LHLEHGVTGLRAQNPALCAALPELRQGSTDRAHSRLQLPGFAEDVEIVESQYPEDLPLNLHDEAHFPADRSSVTYRKGLAALGLGRQFTA